MKTTNLNNLNALDEHSSLNRDQTADHTLLIIGRGRLAKHFHCWFQSLIDECHIQNPNDLLKLKIVTWTRDQNEELLKDLIQKSNVIALAINDASLELFYLKYLKDVQSSSKYIIHFSGALYFSSMIGVHPLMTFSNELYSLDFYKKIHFTIDDAHFKLNQVFPLLKNTSSYLNPEFKTYYHALCVLLGNFSQWNFLKLSNELQKLNIPEKSIDLFFLTSIENVLKNKKQALTGPFVRNDLTTIQQHITCLKGLTINDKKSQYFLDLYQTYLKGYNENNP